MSDVVWTFSPDLLRDAREARGLTRARLAVHCGVSSDSVKHWEYGISVPRVPMLLRVCTVLGVTPNDLCERRVSRRLR